MIDFGIDIPNKINCLPDSLYVEKIEYGEKKTKKGIILPTETMDKYGTFVRPRWAKVKYKAENITNIDIGDWILINHGHWSTSMLMKINGKDTKLWYISPKSFKEGVMAISKVMPKELEEYGVIDE